MKIEITQKVERDVRTLRVNAGVRYWEDSEVNGESDTEGGDNIPCKEGSMWRPIIDLASGVIKNWEKGKTADIHYKVCDNGSYYLEDADGCAVASIEQDYVPPILCPEDRGYGDYIIMKVDAEGRIRNWKPNFEGFLRDQS